MSLKLKITNFFGLDDENYMDEDPYFNESPTMKPKNSQPKQSIEPLPKSKKTATIHTANKQYTPKRPVTRQETRQSKVYEDKATVPSKKVVTMQHSSTQKSTMREKAVSHSNKIMIVEPKAYSEAMIIAKHVISGESVLVNFHLIDEPQARRIVDFLTGAVYAEDGDIKRVADEIFLCTPKGIEIDGTAQSLVDNKLFDL